jgi:acetyl-CoA carboxylase alpha subunit
MNLNYLDFEQPIAELEDKIDALESIKDDADIAKEMDSLKLKGFTLWTTSIKFLMSLLSSVVIEPMQMITP